MAKIQTLKDKNNEIIYPRSVVQAILDANGVTLDTLIAAKANISDVYTKSETYTQEEINSLLNAVSSLNIEVVTELPTENISSTTIYLKGTETAGTNDYEEWIYTTNNDWEMIGTTAIDLTEYLTEENADRKYAKLSLYGDTEINVGRKTGTVVGQESNALGYSTTASEHGSYAEGGFTTASERCAHAEGFNTIASGQYSHVEGFNTVASGAYSHVQGKHNIRTGADGFAHIVGNGTATEFSNAHTLDWSGNAWFSGDVYIKSTSGTNKDEGSKRLITEEEVTNMLGSVGGDISLSDPLAYEAIV